MPDLLLILLIFACMFGTSLGCVFWTRRKLDRRKELTGERDPTELRVRREPGAYLRRQLEEIDDRLLNLLLRGLLPGGCAAIAIAHAIDQSWLRAGVFALATAGAIIWLQRHAQSLIREIRNLRLGLLGERVVAERLRELLPLGWEVFHDLPIEGRNGKFNLDHVAVGPAGVFVIETKARRKHRNRDGAKFHEVTVEGPDLAFPGGVDHKAVPQAQSSASWLRGFLEEKTGTVFPVTPVVVLPGWFVRVNRAGPVGVFNDKNLITWLRSKPGSELTAQQADLIRRQILPLALEEPAA